MGDLATDPTCGSGTTAVVAEQWGRRWISIDTSRVALSIARQRLLTAKFDAYRVKMAGAGGPDDSLEGAQRPLEGAKRSLEGAQRPFDGAQRPLDGAKRSLEGAQRPLGGLNAFPDGHFDPANGFIYKTVPHITLKSIAQNRSLDAIFAKHEPNLEAALAACNTALGEVSDAIRLKLEKKLAAKMKADGKRAGTEADRRRWELPQPLSVVRSPLSGQTDHGPRTTDHGFHPWTVPFDTDEDWPQSLIQAVGDYRKAWRAKMDDVNGSIAASAEQEELVDQPEVIKGVTRVSGPFTVEAVQPPELSLGAFEEAGHDKVKRWQGDKVTEEITPSPPHLVTLSSDEGFAGAPDRLEDAWEIRPVELAPDPTRDPASAAAYLDRMIDLLRQTGVRFPNNKVQRFENLTAIYNSRTGGGFHAEGMWKVGGVGNNGDAKEQSVGVIFGPQHGAVTAAMVEKFIKPARRRFDALVVAGFAFSAEAQQIAAEPDLADFPVHIANISPDAAPGMEGLLKDRHTDQLFTVFGQPRVGVAGPDADGMFTVTMEGVDIYDPVANVVRPMETQHSRDGRFRVPILHFVRSCGNGISA
jgi:adenine-specific DNA-methyltransferase